MLLGLLCSDVWMSMILLSVVDSVGVLCGLCMVEILGMCLR